jgi:hypothetical protein
MADEVEYPKLPTVYGLWNEALEEWFNPGTRKPYFASREEAIKLIPLALRQYSMGKWEVREYPLALSGLDTAVDDVTTPDPARPTPA